MSKLLRCLDQAVDIDSSEMEQAIVDKGYMAQLIEVQRMRGATGGDKFHRLLLNGNGELPAPGLYIFLLFTCNIVSWLSSVLAYIDRAIVLRLDYYFC